MTGQFRNSLVKTKLVDNGLEHLFGGGQRRIRSDLIGNIVAASALLADVGAFLRGVIGSHGLSRRRVFRRSQEGVSAHTSDYHHECDDRSDDMFTNNCQQIHKGDAVIRLFRYPLRHDNLLSVSVLCRNH